MDVDEPNHGTESGYTHARCRCGRCRNAHAEYRRDLRRRNSRERIIASLVEFYGEDVAQEFIVAVSRLSDNEYNRLGPMIMTEERLAALGELWETEDADADQPEIPPRL